MIKSKNKKGTLSKYIVSYMKLKTWEFKFRKCFFPLTAKRQIKAFDNFIKEL
jgi:hypothetical protein